MPKLPIATLPVITVTAALFVAPDGRVLVQKRPEGKPMAGLWEFPGGKVERDETPELALIRELHEELGVTIDVGGLKPLTFASAPLGNGHLLLLLFEVTEWFGTPEPLHAEALQWLMPEALYTLKMPPADYPLIPWIERLVTNRSDRE